MNLYQLGKNISHIVRPPSNANGAIDNGLLIITKAILFIFLLLPTIPLPKDGNINLQCRPSKIGSYS